MGPETAFLEPLGCWSQTFGASAKRSELVSKSGPEAEEAGPVKDSFRAIALQTAFVLAYRGGSCENRLDTR